MGRSGRALRRNASVEFSELLDPIAIGPQTAPEPVVPTDVDLVNPVDRHTEVAAELDGDTTAIAPVEPPQVSRFADAGIDDDRLPLRTSTKRRRR